MNWKCKALLQLALSHMPLGDRVNYLLQLHVTKTLPQSERTFQAAVSSACRHMEAIQRYLQCAIAKATFYEFGTGWDLTVPLVYYALGVEHQILVDVRKLIRARIFSDTLQKFEAVGSDIQFVRRPEKYLKSGKQCLTTLLKDRYGIEYHAPCDARNTGLAAGSIDCITSTATLEHVPREEVGAILRECHRILHDNGVMSLLIDYEDHYSYFDANISGYNFLQYSDRTWAMINSSLHHQNRFRHKDYIELLEESGFKVVEDQRKDGGETDVKLLSRLSLANAFKSYSLEELAVRSALIVARKRNYASTLD